MNWQSNKSYAQAYVFFFYIFKLRLKAMVNYAVSWRWDFISFDLPNEVKDKIYATPMQIYGERKDSLL